MNKKSLITAMLALAAVLSFIIMPNTALAREQPNKPHIDHKKKSDDTMSEKSSMSNEEKTMIQTTTLQLSALERLRKQSGKAFDRAFLSQMIAEHEEAITMARLARIKAKDKQVKELAENLISTHRNHLNMLRRIQAGEKDVMSGRVSSGEDVMMDE